jgi:hypothetical protein
MASRVQARQHVRICMTCSLRRLRMNIAFILLSLLHFY